MESGEHWRGEACLWTDRKELSGQSVGFAKWAWARYLTSFIHSIHVLSHSTTTHLPGDIGMLHYKCFIYLHHKLQDYNTCLSRRCWRAIATPDDEVLLAVESCEVAVVAGCRAPRFLYVFDRDGGTSCSAKRYAHYPFSPGSPCGLRSQRSRQSGPTGRWCGPGYSRGNQSVNEDSLFH